MTGAEPRPRERILRAAADLLATAGREGVSTRSVSAAAGVQPQTIYRQFGDMTGLMNAVARAGFDSYYRSKTAVDLDATDPVGSLRSGWDAHIDFAVANPALYMLMFGDPRPGVSDARADIEAVLHELLERVAAQGRLTTSVARATDIVLAANVGAALAILAEPAASVGASRRSADALRDIVIDALVDHLDGAGTSPVPTAPAGARAAVALAAALPSSGASLTPGERALLGELLARLGQD